jgi:hypothetical protein
VVIVGKSRHSAGLWIITMAGFVLGAWLGISGLWLRVFGEGAVQAPIPLIATLSFGPNLLDWISTSTQGWMRIVIGCGLAGAVIGLWLRQPWSIRSTRFLVGLSFIFLGVALVAAPLILLCLALPSTLSSFQPVEPPDVSRVSS